MSKPKPGRPHARRKVKPKKRPAARANQTPKKPAQEPAKTRNGKLIQDLMAQKEVKGTYKDYVLIASNRLIDWTDSWDMYNEQSNTVGVDGVRLVHKNSVHKFIGPKFAERFWNKTTNKRVPATQEQVERALSGGAS